MYIQSTSFPFDLWKSHKTTFVLECRSWGDLTLRSSVLLTHIWQNNYLLPPLRRELYFALALSVLPSGWDKGKLHCVCVCNSYPLLLERNVSTRMKLARGKGQWCRMVASRCDLTVAFLSPLQLGLPAQDLGKDEPIHRLPCSEEKLTRPSPSVRFLLD